MGLGGGREGEESRITPRLAWKDEVAVGTVREDRGMQVVQAKSEPCRFELLKPCTLQREASLQNWSLASSWALGMFCPIGMFLYV